MTTAKPAFEVVPYDIDNFIRVVADSSFRKSKEEIRSKTHAPYFASYLKAIDAKTLLVERPYIDRDFLEDFAAYYVRCFPAYERACTRIHFFRETFTAQEFESCLSGTGQAISRERLQAAYLGFIVVKPLPKTVFGRTCLTTYPSNGHRFFPTARHFDAHLFGMTLSVAQSLPFQEQDSIVAACATSALWSVFQSTARLHLHQVLTPIEITRAATHLLPIETRVLPNRGLSTQMMAHAIKSVGLEPYLIRVSEQYLLQSALYAYLRSGIPLILGADLIDDDGAGGTTNLGKHALAVTGYSLSGNTIPLGPSKLQLRASRIDKIYAHDDQVGPFARMDLDGYRISDPQLANADSLSTSWPSNAAKGQVRAVPDMLLVPLYHKIRIAWDWILSIVIAFDEFISDLSKVSGVPKMDDLEWDVYLSNVNDIKSDLFSSAVLTGQRRTDALCRPMPRFIWRATALRGTTPIFDILFDATDIDTGDAIVQTLISDSSVYSLLKQLASDPAFDKSPINERAKKILRWIRDN